MTRGRAVFEHQSTHITEHRNSIESTRLYVHICRYSVEAHVKIEGPGAIVSKQLFSFIVLKIFLVITK